MKTIAFVPARANSKSIKNKNIKLFCGKPLIYWVLKELDSSNVEKVVLATESNSIKENEINQISTDKTSLKESELEAKTENL